MDGKRTCKGEVTAYLSLIFILMVTFVGSIMESASIQLAKNYRRADMNRAMECVFAEYQKELLREYEIFALDGSYETGQYAEENILERLSYYGAGGMEHEIPRIQFLTDKGCGAFYDQVTAYMEHKYGIDFMKDKLGMASVWERQEEKAIACEEEERASQTRLEELLIENEEELPADGNPIAHVNELKQSSILTLTAPKDKSISQKQVDPQKMLPSRDKNTGYGEFSDVEAESGKRSSLLFGEYLSEHFSMFTETEQTGVLDYELEYILAGKNSDKENLEAVVKKLLFLRFLPNYTYIQTDSEMKAEAKAAALALCSLLAVPAVTEAAAQGILLAWAFGESVMDIRSLLGGNKVPLLKSKESWQLQLSKLMTLGTAEDQSEGRDAADGLDYADYLRMMLFLTEKETAALRTLGIIEQNMQHIYGQTYFRADLCVSRLETESVCKLRRGIRYQFRTYYGYR